MNSDFPKVIKPLIEIRKYCLELRELPLFCELPEIKKYSLASFASLASLPGKLFFNDEIKMNESFGAILRDKDGNIKEAKNQ